jgi:phospholipid transport system substrate-binding protein
LENRGELIIGMARILSLRGTSRCRSNPHIRACECTRLSTKVDAHRVGRTLARRGLPRRLRRLAMTALLLLSVQNLACAETPATSQKNSAKETVAQTIDEIIKIVEANPGDENKIIRRQKLRDFINPVFDFEEIARRSLGIYWDDATAEEKTEFISAFSDNLARTYLSKVELARRGMVKIETEIESDSGYLVKTIVTHKGKNFALNYRLHLKDGKWMVYNVIIENLNLITANRTEYSGVVRKSKISGLIKLLKEKKEQ